MSNSKQIRAKVDRSSLGTPSAKAARRSVSNATASRIVASANQWASKRGDRKSGG